MVAVVSNTVICFNGGDILMNRFVKLFEGDILQHYEVDITETGTVKKVCLESPAPLKSKVVVTDSLFPYKH